MLVCPSYVELASSIIPRDQIGINSGIDDPRFLFESCFNSVLLCLCRTLSKRRPQAQREDRASHLSSFQISFHSPGHVLLYVVVEEQIIFVMTPIRSKELGGGLGSFLVHWFA